MEKCSPANRRSILAVLLGASLTVLWTCSANIPQVGAINSRLIVYASDANGGRSERITVFASVSDSDGREDIADMYIIHDESELYWHLNPDNWVFKEESGGLWVGANGLEGPLSTLPRGSYRILIVDRAGERAERTFILSAPETKLYKIPEVSISGSLSAAFSSSYKTNTAFFFDAGNNVVKTVSVTPGLRRLDELWGSGDWRSKAYYIALYSFDIPSETGFFSRKIKLSN